MAFIYSKGMGPFNGPKIPPVFPREKKLGVSQYIPIYILEISRASTIVHEYFQKDERRKLAYASLKIAFLALSKVDSGIRIYIHGS